MPLAPETDVLISADSHVMEPADLWARQLGAKLRDEIPTYSEDPNVNKFSEHSGGQDPSMRIGEMARDGVSAEVLYPTRALDQFGILNGALQEASFRIYNEWLEEYCAVAPDRLFGVACISVFRIEEAIREAERAKKAGARGLMIWQSPPQEMSFSGDYYYPLWEAAQALDMPVSLHVVTGAPFPPGSAFARRSSIEFLRFAVTEKLNLVTTSLKDLIGSGTFDRFPGLKVVVVECEVSWMPFFMSQLDKYTADKYTTKRGHVRQVLRPPSEYLGRNLFATFFNDKAMGPLVEDWGADCWMWSNDFPHPNSTWPKSREVIARDLAKLSPSLRSRLLRENVSRLYGLKAITPLAEIH